jgi:hypothetical protein
MAKIACNLAAKHVCDEAIQLLGGTATAGSTPSSAPTATSGASASGRGRWRSSATSSAPLLLAGSRAAPWWKTPAPMSPAGLGAPVPSLPSRPRRGRRRPVAAAGGLRRGRRLGIGRGRGTVAVCDSDEDTLTLAWQAAGPPSRRPGSAPVSCRGCGGGRPGPPSPKAPVTPFCPPPSGLDPGVRWSSAPDRPTPGWRRSSPPGTRWPPATPGGPGGGLGRARPRARDGGRVDHRAGAAAFVLGPIDRTAPSTNGSSPARLVARATRVMAAVDRYRGDGEAATGRCLRRPAVPRRGLRAPAHRATGRAAARRRLGRPPRSAGPSPIPTASWPRRWPSAWAAAWPRPRSRPPWATPGRPPPCSA